MEDFFADKELLNVERQSSNSGWGNFEQPVDSMEKVSDKIMSSFNKKRDLIFNFPNIKKVKCAIPLLDEHGEPVMENGNPVIKKIRVLPYFKGYIEKRVKFPVEDWYNDSVPSSFITSSEANLIRQIDELAISLYLETLQYWPKVNHIPFIQKLYWIKASLADSSKGIHGEAAKQAKTTYTHAVNINREFKDDEAILEKAKQASKKRGLFWTGIGPNFP